MTLQQRSLAADDMPVNFTHFGQYAYTLGNRIFEKKKDWKGNSTKKADHRDNATKDDIFCNPVVYFMIAIANDAPPPFPHQRYQNQVGSK
jgi:hypothetical protein